MSSPTHSGSDDTPTRVPSQTSSPGECAPTSISAGPAGHLVTLVVSAPLSAAAGSTLTADTTIVVHSSGPRVVLQPGSRLEVLRAGAVVARSAAAGGAVIPLPLTAGRTLPAQTVPTTVQLVGCNGVALTAGEYQVRAVLAYGNDPLNSAAAGAVGNFELVSETVTVTVT